MMRRSGDTVSVQPTFGHDPATVLVCPILPSDGWISIELYCRDLLRALQEAGCSSRIDVVTPPEIAGQSRISKQAARYFGYPKKVMAAYRDAKKPAVVHVIDQSCAHLCRRDIPFVASCHDLAIFHINDLNPLQHWLWRYRVQRLSYARRIMAGSESTARDIRHFLKVDPSIIRVSYEGVDPKFCPRGIVGRVGAHLDRLAGLRGDGLLLHVGSNIRRKGMDTLLIALASLVLKGLDLRLVKVGHDPRADGYGGLIEDLGIGDRVIYLGQLSDEDLIDVFNFCDIFCFPSYLEGFGRPLLEAMACGVPVVAADSSSLPELGGEAALYHPPGDAGALEAQLRRVLTEPALAERMRVNGLAIVRRFGWKKHATDLMAAYRDALSDPNGDACEQRTNGQL